MKHLWLPAARVALLVAPLALPSMAMAQSSCSSDGRPRPAALLERFINADCAACWSSAPNPAATRDQVALDWIVPGLRGEDAPLSAAATRDGLARLQALGLPIPRQSDQAGNRSARAGGLRVAHGLPFNGYIGASITLRPAAAGEWTYWLALVETLPAGTEGSPVERNLVRNLLQGSWVSRESPSKNGRQAPAARFFESRSMSIPAGAQAERLRVVGWVQDAKGHIRVIAQSACGRRP